MNAQEIEDAASFVEIYLMRIPLGAFALLPLALPLLWVALTKKRLGSPVAFTGAGIACLYVLAAIFIYLAYFAVTPMTGLAGGYLFTAAPLGAATPSTLSRYIGPLRIYASLLAFAVASSLLLRYLGGRMLSGSASN